MYNYNQLVIYKIYEPELLKFFYADVYGERHESPLGEVIEQPYTESTALDAVRKVRNQLLYDCDWTQLPDSPLSEEEREQWRVYRQALRDITENFQWNITKWPETP